MQTIKEKINQRRRQMMVHSYIYYELNQNIISDAQWSKWAKELQEIQNTYPNESSSVEYEYAQFKDWDGSSGAFLKFGENTKTVAEMLLKNKVSIISKTSIQKPQKRKKESSARSLF